jgi:putative ABC transport system permease protein
MLNQFFSDPLLLGAAQAVIATVLALAVMFIARAQGIHLEREILIALARGVVQIVAVGVVLVTLFAGPNWPGALVMAAMMVTASVIASRRARKIPGAFTVALISIALGAGSVIALMTALGAIDPAITSLVPVGSMLIANAMNTSALALERFRAEVESHTGSIETALALGAAPDKAVAPYTRATVQASMIPNINSLRSLGIVWIPGLMAGMILSGSDPVYAGIYQFVVIAMIFASSGLTSVLSALLVRSRAFSPAEQLVLRAGEA